MAAGTGLVRLPELTCHCGTALAGLGLLLRGGRKQPTMKEDPVPCEDALSDCSTAAPTDSSDDELSASGASPKSGRSGRGGKASSGRAAIIFDWDDTLLPTSYIRHVLGETSGAAEAPPEVRAKLAGHGERVKAALMSARAAAHVSIVTLSARPWVTQSAERYFPDADIAALLDELDITVYYAGEYATAAPQSAPADPSQQTASLEYFSALKQSAMSRCLVQANARLPKRKNVISIGDSIIEQHALKQLIPRLGRSRQDKQKPLCKIVKLMEGPSLDELTDQLVFLDPWFGAMVAQQTHFQLCINTTQDLATSALDFVKLLNRRSCAASRHPTND